MCLGITKEHTVQEEKDEKNTVLLRGHNIL